MSLPSRERGLKYFLSLQQFIVVPVAPLAGAWIEIRRTDGHKSCGVVAPLAGAWIEIVNFKPIFVSMLVAPLAGAWIEMIRDPSERSISAVAPLAGAWIEISPISCCVIS